MVPLKSKALSLRDLSRILRPSSPDHLIVPDSWTTLIREFEVAAKDGATGIVVINGTTGSGKTSFAKLLQRTLAKHDGLQYLWGSVIEPISASGWLLPFLSDIIGGPSLQPLSPRAMIARLGELCSKDSSHSLVLMIDGADLVSPDALAADLVGLFSTIEDSNIPLLAIINASETTTSALLSAPALSHKSTIVRNLPKISDGEMLEILERRLEQAEVDVTEFKNNLNSVVTKSQGIPAKALRDLLNMGSVTTPVLNTKQKKSNSGKAGKSDPGTKSTSYADLLTIKKSGS